MPNEAPGHDHFQCVLIRLKTPTARYVEAHQRRTRVVTRGAGAGRYAIRSIEVVVDSPAGGIHHTQQTIGQRIPVVGELIRCGRR